MKKLIKITNLQTNYPSIFSIAAILLFYIFSIPTIDLLLYIRKNIKDEFLYNTFSFLIEFITPISTILVVLIFKNLKIYHKKNFFKTLKISYVYLIIEIINACYYIFLALNKNKEFKSIHIIVLEIIFLVFDISFFEESIYRGLILNMFAKKYINKPHGILKILFFPALIFGFMHITNYFFNHVEIKSVISQMIICFFTGMLFNAIYMRGGNIISLILIHTISNIAAFFESSFLKNSGEFSDVINKINLFDWLINLAYIPMTIILTIVLLRKSKLEEVKENLKAINKI